jgi:hypothetical protein
MSRRIILSCLVLSFAITCGCAGLGPSSQVPPSSVGLDMSIKKLKAEFKSYEVYYSANLHNPSAILFIPKRSDFRLDLHWDWKPVKEKKRLNRMLDTIDKIYPRLSAIMTPTDQEKSRRELLAFIYTPAYASIRSAEEPNTYFLRNVPEQPHPDFRSEGNGGGR